MSNKELRLAIEEENEIMFKKSIRKLFEVTFILEDKDPSIFDFLASESNQEDINNYLDLIGFRVVVDPSARYAQLQQKEENDEIPGLKMANVERFSNHEIHLLIVLMETFLESYGNGAMVVTTKGDIVDKIKAYELNIDSRKLSGALKKFQKYNLIKTDLSSKDEMEQVILYPSLAFGWDRDQLEAYITENIRQDGEAEEDLSMETENDENPEYSTADYYQNTEGEMND